jgi:single-stranded-DNA-specific exonuclease
MNEGDRKMGVNWLIKTPHQGTVSMLARKLDIPRPIASVLVNRGITQPHKALEFLVLPPSMVPHPMEMEDMDKAVERIEKALKNGEQITVYGDYDADGVTATALLVDYLRSRGGRVTAYIPHRTKLGYGLKSRAIEELASTGSTLIITVDCGISNHEEVKQAEDMGIDVIITDHHTPPAFLPNALAILHPKIGDYPYSDLAGVGVALKLVEGLSMKQNGEEARGEVWRGYLDLVALGTIGDMVPLLGENRFYTSFGLKLINQKQRKGLSALIEVAKCANRKITPWEVSFLLAPRLNAAGRMGEANRAMQLLISTENSESQSLAQELQRENLLRQKMEEAILQDTLEMLEKEESGPFILLGKKEWHPGIIGIVASKLAERFQRPASLVAFSEKGIGKGSARSYGNVDIYTILSRCSPWLKDLGGHKAAAGFTIHEKNFESFKEALWEETLRLLPHTLPPNPVVIEETVEIDELDSALLRGLQSLAPFGEGHPQPVFLLSRVQVCQARVVGKGHLKFAAVKNNIGIDAIAFGMGDLHNATQQGLIDLAFTPELNHWNGEKVLQLKVKAMRGSRIS